MRNKMKIDSDMHLNDTLIFSAVYFWEYNPQFAIPLGGGGHSTFNEHSNGDGDPPLTSVMLKTNILSSQFSSSSLLSLAVYITNSMSEPLGVRNRILWFLRKKPEGK